MLSVSVPMSGVCGRAEQQRLAEPPQAAGGQGQEQAAEHELN